MSGNDEFYKCLRLLQAAYLLFPLYSGGSLAELCERLGAQQRSLPTVEVLHLFLQARRPACAASSPSFTHPAACAMLTSVTVSEGRCLSRSVLGYRPCTS